ncbi:Uncharacterised protein [Mycobacteroides abscessus subsp. abscessus]|nr:Uncharacterised protein [Mycobacteroides abscessus subsp. abscessus]
MRLKRSLMPCAVVGGTDSVSTSRRSSSIVARASCRCAASSCALAVAASRSAARTRRSASMRRKRSATCSRSYPRMTTANGSCCLGAWLDMVRQSSRLCCGGAVSGPSASTPLRIAGVRAKVCGSVRRSALVGRGLDEFEEHTARILRMHEVDSRVGRAASRLRIQHADTCGRQA